MRSRSGARVRGMQSQVAEANSRLEEEESSFGKERYSFRLPKNLWEDMKLLAKFRGTNVTVELEGLIQDYLNLENVQAELTKIKIAIKDVYQKSEPEE